MAPLEEVAARLEAVVLLPLDLDVRDELFLEELLRLRALLARALVPLDVLDEPFRLFDLLELEPRGVDRLLEDRVVWAMGIASLGFRASCAFSHRRCKIAYPPG
jgi:hypothetical protein